MDEIDVQVVIDGSMSNYAVCNTVGNVSFILNKDNTLGKGLT